MLTIISDNSQVSNNLILFYCRSCNIVSFLKKRQRCEVSGRRKVASGRPKWPVILQPNRKLNKMYLIVLKTVNCILEESQHYHSSYFLLLLFILRWNRPLLYFRTEIGTLFIFFFKQLYWAFLVWLEYYHHARLSGRYYSNSWIFCIIVLLKALYMYFFFFRKDTQGKIWRRWPEQNAFGYLWKWPKKRAM